MLEQEMHAAAACAMSASYGQALTIPEKPSLAAMTGVDVEHAHPGAFSGDDADKRTGMPLPKLFENFAIAACILEAMRRCRNFC